MNLLARISILVFCLIIAFLLAIPLALNNSSLKFRIEQKISQKLGINVEIKDDVRVAFFPAPKIMIQNVNFNNLKDGDNIINLYIKNLTIKLDFFALVQRKVKINKLILESPQMELIVIQNHAAVEEDNQKSNEANKKPTAPIRAKISDKIFNFKDAAMESLDFKNIGQIEVVNGSFLKRGYDNQVSLEFKKVTFDVKNNIKRQIFIIDGNFSSDEIPTEFKMVINTNKNNDSKLIFNSSILKVEINGKFHDSKIDNLVKANFSGKFDAEIINLKAVLSKYFSKNSLLYNKINNSKPIQISSDIEGKAGEIKASNIVINSQLMSGNGQIDANFSTARPVIDIDITFGNIDIDSLWLTSANTNYQSTTTEKNIIGNFISSQDSDPNKTKIILPKESKETFDSSLKNIDLTAEIKVKTAKYLAGELKDIDLYFVLAGHGEILLQPLVLKIPGNGMLRINGAFEDDNNIPKFIGKVDATGKNLQQFLSWIKIEPQNLKPHSLADYNLVADILLLPHFLVLSNLYAGLNNNKNIISGNITKDDSSGVSRITSDFKINDLNVEDYFLISEQNQYLSSGSLLKKLVWLNSTSSNNSISLFFNKLTYKQNIFRNQPLKMEFGQGYFKLIDLQLKSDDINVKGFLNVNLTNTIPVIDINLAAENFTYITKNLEEAADNKSKTSSTFKSGLVENFFNFPSFDDFSGTLSIDVRNLKVDGVGMNNVKVSGKIKNGELVIKDAELGIFGGNLKYNGSVILKGTKAFSGSFELINIDNRTFLNNLLTLDNISGISNISGVVSVAAKNRDDFFKNLDIQLKFISGNVIVDRFGIDDLSVKMLQPAKNQLELRKPVNILFNKNARSYFKTVTGHLDIRRNNRENKLRIETSDIGMNSVTTGSLDLGNSVFTGSSNFVFLTGTRQRQIPISIAINYNGKFDNILKTTNIDQVNQYLNY